MLLGEDNEAAKSDEAFLERTKLKAREALGHALLVVVKLHILIPQFGTGQAQFCKLCKMFC